MIAIAIVAGLLPGGSVGNYGEYGAMVTAGSLIFAPIVLMLRAASSASSRARSAGTTESSATPSPW
jgi:hypothetical protein